MRPADPTIPAQPPTLVGKAKHRGDLGGAAHLGCCAPQRCSPSPHEPQPSASRAEPRVLLLDVTWPGPCLRGAELELSRIPTHSLLPSLTCSRASRSCRRASIFSFWSSVWSWSRASRLCRRRERIRCSSSRTLCQRSRGHVTPFWQLTPTLQAQEGSSQGQSPCGMPEFFLARVTSPQPAPAQGLMTPPGPRQELRFGGEVSPARGSGIGDASPACSSCLRPGPPLSLPLPGFSRDLLTCRPITPVCVQP